MTGGVRGEGGFWKLECEDGGCVKVSLECLIVVEVLVLGFDGVDVLIAMWKVWV